jgi:hypothetical protein
MWPKERGIMSRKATRRCVERTMKVVGSGAVREGSTMGEVGRGGEEAS